MTKGKTQKIFKKIPTVRTERLTLRKLTPSDSADMYEYSRRDAVTKYLLWYEHENEHITREYLAYVADAYKRGAFYDWAVTLTDSGKMIGTVGFTKFDLPNNSAEIGYVLNPEYAGKGIATEAAKKIVNFGFNFLKLHRIEARHMVGNDASHRVMEKLGMKEEGTFRESYFVGGSYRTVTVCSILANEYQMKEE